MSREYIEIEQANDDIYLAKKDAARLLRLARIALKDILEVEDVLREFAEGLGVPVADSYIAVSAAKLQMREDA